MSKVLVTESYLGNIADAIRLKNGASTTYRPGDMAAAIEALDTSGIHPTGTKNITQNGTHDVTQYANANVSVQPNLQSKSVTENGTVTPDQGYDGLSSVVVNVSGGGGGGIFGEDVVSREYSGNLTTHTFQKTGYYAVLGAIDGFAGCSIEYSVNGATVIDSNNKQASASQWGAACVGVLLTAQQGNTIQVYSNTSYSRQIMIVVFLTNAITSISNITLDVKKDSSCTLALSSVAKKYGFYIAGSTGDNSVTVTITSTNTQKWADSISTPIRLHKFGAYEGNGAISCTAQGSSYSTNYVMLFEASA